MKAAQSKRSPAAFSEHLRLIDACALVAFEAMRVHRWTTTRKAWLGPLWHEVPTSEHTRLRRLVEGILEGQDVWLLSEVVWPELSFGTLEMAHERRTCLELVAAVVKATARAIEKTSVP